MWVLGWRLGKAHTTTLPPESSTPLPWLLQIILFTSLSLRLLIYKVGINRAATEDSYKG